MSGMLSFALLMFGAVPKGMELPVGVRGSRESRESRDSAKDTLLAVEFLCSGGVGLGMPAVEFRYSCLIAESGFRLLLALEETPPSSS